MPAEVDVDKNEEFNVEGEDSGGDRFEAVHA